MILSQRDLDVRGIKPTRWILALFCAAGVAGCAQGAGTLPAANAPSGHSASRAKGASGSGSEIYAFKAEPDGSSPYASLTNVGGTLYGTTSTGGTANSGTVFSVTPGGSETILHSFTGGSDGAAPIAGLINVKGTLYGTTTAGNGGGTVFSITTSGVEKVLHDFTGGGDGLTPYASLIYFQGALYGTTAGGGATGNGTVFKITRAGKNSTEIPIYSFTGGSDGSGPQAALIQYKGNFYGTTCSGGGTNNYGTVFEVTPSGQETVLHSFTGMPDGRCPVASLLAYGGKLYGMTVDGGAKNLGMVFKMNLQGKLTVIHSFSNSPNEGYYPQGPNLTNVNGMFYGTVTNSYTGSGGIFAITPTGSESLVHTFNSDYGGPSGPLSGVVDVGGTLYGTTVSGGLPEQGTVYGVPL
ncbi:MAG: choice-of-anchor tandem repeat GloVer-containing protein [Candidatus Cybelea sp.]